MRKILILLLLPLLSFSQDFDLKKTFKFSTFYGAINGGTSLSDIETFSVLNGLTTTTVQTPYDYNVTLGVRKIARFGYENKANTFYDGTESSYSDAATIGKIDGFEFLFEVDYKRQEGIDYVDQNHFLRYVADNYILKGEFLQDGFADINYFETSARYRKKMNEKLSFNIGGAQRIAEPYGYDPLDEWRLSDCVLYVTKEPCPMCAGAIVNSRLKQVVFGCYDEKEGCCGSLYQLCGDPRFKTQVAVKGGVLEQECKSIIKEFFQYKRKINL